MIEKLLGTYSNGWGHLILTVVVFMSTIVLLGVHSIDLSTFAFINSPVLTFWFGTGIANKILQAQAAMPVSDITPVAVETPAPVRGKKNAT